MKYLLDTNACIVHLRGKDANLRREIMLTLYLKTALRQAHYEILADSGHYYGEIAECNGVYATAPSLEECREQLEEVLEEWVLFRVHRNLTLPVVNGVELAVKEETA